MNQNEPPFGQLRVPPHSIEAESSVLGGLLLSNQAWERVDDLLSPEDFFRHEHRLIYTAIGQMVGANHEADVVTVFEHLERAGLGQEVGGLAYINSLAQGVPNAGNIRRYAELVRERSILRQLAAVGDTIAASAFAADGQPVAALLERAETSVLAIAETGGRLQQSFQSSGNLVVQLLDRIEQLADDPREITGTATGFYDLDRMLSGLQPGDLVILAARPSMGKAQPLHARVLLQDGSWKAMGDLRVGDELASVDGAPSVVEAIYPQGILPVNRITFSDGRAAEACDEHLWRVRYRDWDEARSLSTAQLRKKLEARRYQGRLWIDMPTGDFGLERELPIDPWLLGALIGNGHMPTDGTVRITTDKPHTLDRIRLALPTGVAIASDGIDHRLVVPRGQANPLLQAVQALGLRGCLAGQKFIPQAYLGASREQRLELLHGLMDTDGWCEKTGSAQYSTASRTLARDVECLVRSLGGWAKTRTKQAPTYSYLGEKRIGQPSHIVSVVLVENPFSIPAKRDRHMKVTRRKRPTVSSIEFVRNEPAQCIRVSHPSRLYITDDYVVTHNTAAALNIAEHVAIVERLPVAVFSMEMGSMQLMLRMVGSIGRIDHQRLRSGRLTNEEWGRLPEAVEKLRDIELHIEETPGLLVGELRSKARRLARQVGGKLGLIVVDYLQLMSVSSGMSDENRATAIGEITRGLKMLAKEMGCPVIALSQLSRGVESRTDKRPMMSDLRESGAIEQDADVIMFIYRDDYYNKDSKEPGVAEIIISKQRNGPTGTVRLAFLKEMTRFESLATSSY